MLTPEERSLEMFNAALKLCVNLSYDMKKEEARNIVLNNLLAIKVAIYDMAILTDVTSKQIQKTIAYYDQIKNIIQKI